MVDWLNQSWRAGIRTPLRVAAVLDRRQTVRNQDGCAYRSAMTARVSIQLLGPVKVEVGDAPLAVDTRKAIALLAYLAVTARPASANRWRRSCGPKPTARMHVPPCAARFRC